FEAVTIETEKNAASGSTVIDENKGVETSIAELKNQVEGLDGLDSDFTSMREDFRVALNILSGDLKREIHDLRDSIMGEIMKIRDEFGEEVSTLHQVIEDLQADMALCKWSLDTGGGNPNHGLKIDVPKPSPFVGKGEARAVDDFLWETEQYLEEVNVEDDASKIKMVTQYLEDIATLWRSRRYGDIKRAIRTIREYVKEFTTFVLEILKHSDQDSLFYFLDGLQGWAKTELERRGAQDLSTDIAHAEALINFSTRRESSKPKDRNVNQEKGGGEKNTQPKVDPARKPPTGKDKNLKTSYKSGGCFICDGPHRARDFPKKASLNVKAKTETPKVVRKGLQYMEATINGVKVRALVDSGATHNFVADDEAKRLRINATKGSGTIKAVNSLAKAIHRVAKDVRAFPMPFANSLCILDGGKTYMVSTERDAKSRAKTLLAMQFNKRIQQERALLFGGNKARDGWGFKQSGGTKGDRAAPYRMPPPELEELRKQLKELMDAGYIRPSKAPYDAPVLFQRKKDGSLRICIDYRALNKVIIKNKYHIPLIADLFDQLGKARYFTKLDFRSGYYQVRIAEGDEAKMTCVTRHTLEEHVLHLKQVFQVLRDNELYVKLEKCSFAQDEVEFLGHKIKDGGLMMSGAKIKAFQDWEPPTKVTKLRSFLGLVNYYRRFIMGYSAIASPLTDLLKKNKAWIWDEECQAAFESLKKAVMEEPVLRLPDVTMPFELHTDALDFAIGGVLMQDGHPIAFEIRKLNHTKKKYMVQEKEMTAVVHCLRIWRHYLLDFLAEFDYQLEYNPRKANVVADALSRKAEFAAITYTQFFLQDRINEGLEHDPLAKKIISLAKDGRT
ncbi:putative nucleotidyltransferase, ribonuclease H, partial [Tanacetum coccineum]